MDNHRLILFGFLLTHFYPIVMKTKLSKAMKAKQNEANAIRNDKDNSISYQELRKMLIDVSDAGSSKNNNQNKQKDESGRTSVTSERSFLVIL